MLQQLARRSAVEQGASADWPVADICCSECSLRVLAKLLHGLVTAAAAAAAAHALLSGQQHCLLRLQHSCGSARQVGHSTSC
jgi:hypothetical protein